MIEPREVGVLLARARMEQGRSVAEMAQQLKLLPRQITALEEGRFDELPGPVFVRGFVRNYARALGLDPEPLLASLEVKPSAEAVKLAPASNAEGEIRIRRSRPWRIVLRYVLPLFVLLLLVTVYFDWFRMPSPTRQETAVLLPPAVEAQDTTTDVLGSHSRSVVAEPFSLPAVSAASEDDSLDETTQSAPASDVSGPEKTLAEAPSVVSPENPPEPEPVLRFRAEGRSWVEVRDASGTVVFSRILDAGQEASLDGTPPFSLVVGNAAVVRVEFRGEPIEIKEVSKNGVGRIRLP